MPSLENTIENIKSVKIQGAKEIAIYALEFLRGFCKNNGFKLRFEVVAMMLEEARPTAVVLHNCLEILKKRRSLKTIDGLLERLERTTAQIAKKGSTLIKSNHVIMTHCHSGEALAVIEQAWKNKKISIIATETEPLEQGVKTANELAKLKIPVTLITDSAVGYFMKEVDAIVVGADAIRSEGIVNKIGTSLIALAAKSNKKPLYVVANTLKLDNREKFKIEERPPNEVYHKLKGVKIRNPAFDITKFNLVTRVVTEKGIFTPKQIVRMLR